MWSPQTVGLPGEGAGILEKLYLPTQHECVVKLQVPSFQSLVFPYELAKLALVLGLWNSQPETILRRLSRIQEEDRGAHHPQERTDEAWGGHEDGDSQIATEDQKTEEPRDGPKVQAAKPEPRPSPPEYHLQGAFWGCHIQALAQLWSG